MSIVIKKVDKFGTIRYINELRRYHRENGPAVEHRNGDNFWYINGLIHREDGPAIYFPEENYKEYWLNGKRYDNIYNISSDEEWAKLVIKILLFG